MAYYRFLADLVVVVHGAFIGFVLVGMLLILLGIALRWRWVRNFWFRTLHFLAIGVVVAQALLGVLCPLTTLEKHLRGQAGQATYPGSFVAHWVHELIFYEAPPRVFTISYCLFGAAVLATLLLAPPRWPGRRGSDKR